MISYVFIKGSRIDLGYFFLHYLLNIRFKSKNNNFYDFIYKTRLTRLQNVTEFNFKFQLLLNSLFLSYFMMKAYKKEVCKIFENYKFLKIMYIDYIKYLMRNFALKNMLKALLIFMMEVFCYFNKRVQAMEMHFFFNATLTLTFFSPQTFLG